MVTWRAGAFPGVTLGIFCAVLMQRSWWLLIPPALAGGFWAAARIAASGRRQAADRVAAAGAAGLLGSGIVEILGTFWVYWADARNIRGAWSHWDAGEFASGYLLAPFLMLIPAAGTLVLAIIGALLSAGIAAKR